MTPRIRFATPADAKHIHRLIVELAVYEREPEAVKVSPETLAEQLSSPNPPFECLIAETPEGQPLGIALFFHTYSTWTGRRGIHLEDLYVTPAARGLGLGRLLMDSLRALCRERDCARLEWAVLDWNTPAIDFYAHLGAEHLKTWEIWRLSGDDL